MRVLSDIEIAQSCQLRPITEIAASAGKTCQDLTAFRDPLMGLGPDAEVPFERDTGDGFTADYNPHHNPSNGRFTSGGGSGIIGKTKYAPSPQRSFSGIQLKPKTYARLTGILNTRFPGLEAGEKRRINDGKHWYIVQADGYGGMEILETWKVR